VRIKKMLNLYYNWKISSQKLPVEKMDFKESLRFEEKPKKKRTIVPDLGFHLGLAALFLIVFVIKAPLYRSFEQLDPKNENFQYLQKQVKKGIDSFYAKFWPLPMDPKNGGK
jgi:hypothetical protein